MTWRRALLLVLVLLPLVGSAAAWWLLYTTGGARFAWARVDAALGDVLSVESIDGAVASGLRLRGFRYDGDAATVTVADFAARIDVRLLPLGLTLADGVARDADVVVPASDDPERSGELADLWPLLDLPFDLDVDGLSVDDLQVVAGRAPETLRFDRVELRGSWSADVRIQHLLVQRDDVTLTLAGSLGLRDAGPFSGRVSIDAGPGLTSRFTRIEGTATVSGDFSSYDYDTHGTLTDVALGLVEVTASGDGTADEIRVHDATFAGEHVNGGASGRFSWAGGVRVDAATRLARLDPWLLVDSWPSGESVEGAFDLAYDPARLHLGNARVAFIARPGEALGWVTLTDADDSVEGSITWTSLTWPIAAAEPSLVSPSGDVDIAGHLDDWSVDGRAALNTAEFGDGEFRAAASGDRHRAEVSIVDGRILGGRVEGNAAVDWRDTLSWSVDLGLDRVHTGPLVAEWPGDITGRVRAEGRSDPLRFRAELDGVTGRLRDWPLRADGGVALGDDGLTARRLLIRHGANELQLDGGLEVPEGLRFVATVGDIATYVDGIRGDVAANGTLRLENGEPVGAAELRSERLVSGGTTLSGTTLSIDGTRQYQAATLSSRIGSQPVVVAVAGGPDDPASPESWHGILSELLIGEPDVADRDIRLINSAAIEVSRNAVRVDQACLKGIAAARLCVDVDWVAGRSLAITADLDSVAVDRVNQFVDTGFLFDQLVTGRLRWEKAVGQPLTAFADLVIGAGRIRNARRDDLVVETGPGRVTFDVRDGRLLEGRLVLPMPGTGRIDGEFTLADVGDIAGSAIDGRLNAVVDDIDVVRVLVPLLDEAHGRLVADVTLAGTASGPRLAGEARLDDGLLVYRPLGTRLEQLTLRSRIEPDGSFEVSGAFLAGEGRGTITSSGAYGAGAAPLSVAIRGNSLRVIDVRDVTATADADLEIGFSDGLVTLNGNVVVPHARISPRSLPATRYTESEDVVIVAGELPDERDREADSGIRLDGALAVSLGSDVVVDIDLAKATVTGTTRFEWDENLVPLANGRYDIAGDVQAYGQVLQITEGMIRFTNVPADNPTIRIRAEREIFGNSQIKTAGVLIAGTVKRPIVEAYTDPATTEERALTLLVTGSDFDMEQGVGAIDFGTYIAPRLFVSYGVGLFDQENVISARYDLGRGFGVKATSGQKESGVDFIYRIER